MLLRPRIFPKTLGSAGFSLVEVVVVMGITAMMIGTAMFIMNTPNEEREIREEHGLIEDLIRQGRALSLSYQQTFVLELSEGKASLQPLVMPQEDDESYNDEASISAGSNLRKLTDLDWPRVVELSLDYQMRIRRWGKLDFEPITDRHKEEILLEVDGLFEPISVLLTKDDGANSLSRVYHPLTGLAEDEELTITGSQ